MRKLVLFLLVVLLLLPWSSDLAAQVTTAAALVSVGSTEVPVPIVSGTFAQWTGGALVVVQYRFSGAPVFRILDRQGNEISRTTLMIPEASGIALFGNSIARGPDGSLAIIGSGYMNATGEASRFLAVLSPEGTEQTFVPLSPFLAEAVTVAADGAIWVAGHVVPEIAGNYDRSQNLIRRYDRTGKILGSFIPWSSFDLPRPSLSPDARSILASSPDRVGWYSPIAQTYIEFSLDGSVANRIKAPRAREDGLMLNMALCEDNSLFVSSTLNNGPNQKASWGIYVLDRERSEWSFIPRAESWGQLYGCDGTRLAATTNFRFISWLAPTRQ